jgi:hypothetical protein
MSMYVCMYVCMHVHVSTSWNTYTYRLTREKPSKEVSDLSHACVCIMLSPERQA